MRLSARKQRYRVITTDSIPKPIGSYCHERKKRKIEPTPKDAIYVSTYYCNNKTYVIAMKHGSRPHMVYGELFDPKFNYPNGEKFIRVKLAYHGVHGDSGREVRVRKVDSSIEKMVLGNFKR